ncbi:MAG TPA: DegT/DnrJ/EryC1/StrS family aminotransferase, partial [Flavobacteriaceae bacterium]|nr:DegT/DnrJ/EryC1/StrS family aminotransferase [Flavobacteriaceae bacterium]
ISGSPDTHVFHQYTLRISNSAKDKNASTRDKLAEHLMQNGIPFGIYYPIPLHSQKAYHDKKYREADFGVTNRLVQEVISLPMHTELDEEQIEFITEKVNEFTAKNS